MWDQRYGAAGFAYGTEPNDFLVSVEDRLRGEVLCLGEGEGRNAVWLAGRGLAVTAVDLSAVGLAKAERLAAERGVVIDTVCADLSGFDLGESRWDAVVSIWCHLPAPLRADLHRRVVRALRPGGVFVLEAYTPAQLALGTGGPKDPSLLVDPEDLRVELAGLDLVRFEVVTREVHEGPYHDGTSAVVRALGVRS